MSRKLLSVVIPCFNYGKYLQRAVKSVMSQGIKDIELIIIDDGSTDNTQNIARQLIDEYSLYEIKYFFQLNAGASAAKNKGISLSNGEFIILLDADDSLADGALKKINEFIGSPENDVDALIGAHISFDEEQGAEKIRRPGNIISNKKLNFKNYLFKKISVSNGAAVFHRKIFNEIKFSTSLVSGEDIPVFALIFANFKCKSVNYPLARIFKHSDSLRSRSPGNDLLRSDIIKEIFTSPLLPHEMLTYQKPYAAYRCISAFKKEYRRGNYKKGFGESWDINGRRGNVFAGVFNIFVVDETSCYV